MTMPLYFAVAVAFLLAFLLTQRGNLRRRERCFAVVVLAALWPLALLLVVCICWPWRDA